MRPDAFVAHAEMKWTADYSGQVAQGGGIGTYTAGRRDDHGADAALVSHFRRPPAARTPESPDSDLFEPRFQWRNRYETFSRGEFRCGCEDNGIWIAAIGGAGSVVAMKQEAPSGTIACRL